MNANICLALILTLVLPACHGGAPVLPARLAGCACPSLDSDWSTLAHTLQDPAPAERLIRAIACAPSSEAPTSFIQAHLDDQVKFVSYATGEESEDVRVLPRAQAQAEVGAYFGSCDFRFRLSRRSSGELELSAQNEACVELTVLGHRPAQGDWVVRQYETACD